MLLRVTALVLAMGSALSGCVSRAEPPESGADGFDATSDGTVSDEGAREVGPVFDAQFAPFDVAPSDVFAVQHGLCNTLMITADEVIATHASGAFPAAHGGDVVNGYYVLTASVFYGDAGMDAATSDVGAATDASALGDALFGGPRGRAEALLVQGTSVFLASRVGDAMPTTVNFALVTAGANAMARVGCPAGGALALDGYDASAEQLVLYSSSEGRVDTYTRR